VEQEEEEERGKSFFRSIWYPWWGVGGKDASSIFDNSGLIVLTDAFLYKEPEPQSQFLIIPSFLCLPFPSVSALCRRSPNKLFCGSNCPFPDLSHFPTTQISSSFFYIPLSLHSLFSQSLTMWFSRLLWPPNCPFRRLHRCPAPKWHLRQFQEGQQREAEPSPKRNRHNPN
jgi:hypothetical protein